MERIPLVLYSSLSTFIGLAIFDGTTVFAATCFTYFESNVETSEMGFMFRTHAWKPFHQRRRNHNGGGYWRRISPFGFFFFLFLWKIISFFNKNVYYQMIKIILHCWTFNRKVTNTRIRRWRRRRQAYISINQTLYLLESIERIALTVIVKICHLTRMYSQRNGPESKNTFLYILNCLI